MRAWLSLFASAVLVALCGAADAEGRAPVPVADVVKGAASCALAVGKAGVDQSVLERDGWRPVPSTGDVKRFQQSTSGPLVSLPADRDGVRRICVISALLASNADQQELSRALSTLLHRQPYEQPGSTIWMFGGNKGLQLYREGAADAPSVRIIAAFFPETR